ncbi:unnamed protein product [Fraxinus pennsylvanica]|uniref:Prolamin-like domain-containing protein n=1 Tax=Fraxinus pennsylvanica TaxID=56036 RepID=A0AAD2DLD6_9LAMI|nr:unnamed protein product [Fraxinus pennsylvanica]
MLFLVIATSAVSMSSHVAAAPHPQLSAFGALSDEVLKVEGFLPCLESLTSLEACTVDIFKAVFGLPLRTSCCQVVNKIAKTCLPEGIPFSQVFLPTALENCVIAPEPPTSI